MEILGAPLVEVELASDRPSALLAVRLSDVAPDGAATRVTYGVLNLSHRESHEFPSALEPGRHFRTRLQLKHAAHVFPTGHRIRLAFSTNYWPLMWPSAEAATLHVVTGESSFVLPIRAPRSEDEALPPFEAVETATPAPRTVLRPPRVSRTISREAASGAVTVTIVRDEGAVRLDETGIVTDSTKVFRHSVHDGDPLTASTDVHGVIRFSRGSWRPEIRGRARLTATKEAFRLQTDLDVLESGDRIYSRSWSHVMPRDFL